MRQRRHRAVELRKFALMPGHGLGKLLDQVTELLHLGRERVIRRTRFRGRALGPAFQCRYPAPHFADLARHVGGAARELGELVAGGCARAAPGRDDVVDGECAKQPDRHGERLGFADAEGEIERDPGRAGDQHHA